MSKLIINEKPLIVIPTLAIKVGLGEAITLQQLHFRLNGPDAVKHDGRLWYRASVAEFVQGDFPFWSDNTMRRVLDSLEARGLIETAYLSKNTFDRAKFYTVNYSAVDSLVDSPDSNESISIFPQMDLPDSGKSDLPESGKCSISISKESSSSLAQPEISKNPTSQPLPTINLVTEYERAFATFPSPLQVDMLMELGTDYGQIATQNALAIAAKSGKPNLRYVEGILKKQRDGDTQPRSNGYSNGNATTPTQPKPESDIMRWAREDQAFLMAHLTHGIKDDDINF